MSCSRATTLEPGVPPKADWRRASHGISLCIYASFLLLCTTGYLPWSFWLDAIALWPLLIMSGGIQIAFEKTRVPWLVLLGPAVVLAGLVWVATGSLPDVPRSLWKAQSPIPRPAGAQRVKLDCELFGSRLLLQARPLADGSLVEVRSVEQMLESQLKLEEQDDTARVRLVTTRHRGVTFAPSSKQLYDLGVPSELPLRIELRGAMNRSQLDLSRGRFEGGFVDGAFQVTNITLPAVDRPVKLVQKGAFNALRLNVPEGTPVNVRGAGFPLNLVKRRLAGEPGRAGYEVVVEGAFTAIALETRRASPAEAAPTASPSAAPEAAPSARPKPEAEPHKASSPAPNRG